MPDQIWITLEYMLRIILSALCGAAIGYERENRGKGAGIRTHIIVAIASSLMMIVSKYGFNDLLSGDYFRLDPSRVAAQIVSGVGFLGAGMIFIQKRLVTGLTTAAGIWATSGIGMAVGSGMYAVGISTSLVILTVQVLLHRNLKFLQQSGEQKIFLSLADSDAAVSYMKDCAERLHIRITGMKCKRTEDAVLEVELTVVLPQNLDFLKLLECDRQFVKSIDIQND